jgi:hypothetical protein
MGLSLRAYARHRADLGLPGSSLQAVQRARDKGRITLEPDGTVDPERADREWTLNTDLTDAPGAVVEAHAQAAPAAAAGMASRARRSSSEAPPEDDGIPALGKTLPENNAVKAYWQAKTAELEFKQAAGELVPAAGVRAELESVFRSTKTKLLGIPSRARQLLPGLSVADVGILENLVREACKDLAKGEVG